MTRSRPPQQFVITGTLDPGLIQEFQVTGENSLKRTIQELLWKGYDPITIRKKEKTT